MIKRLRRTEDIAYEIKSDDEIEESEEDFDSGSEEEGDEDSVSEEEEEKDSEEENEEETPESAGSDEEEEKYDGPIKIIESFESKNGRTLWRCGICPSKLFMSEQQADEHRISKAHFKVANRWTWKA
eukprot:TRINITY_DN3601_c0_g1_i1.p1 TRINITY_DN3601_c0_g1~~TRINITY_DN3601_c0_g1_i1.p1  ORF type:complete len:142 (+),score=34.84 TRINITY_DN3601_c0_g1_i1:48-428(+)